MMKKHLFCHACWSIYNGGLDAPEEPNAGGLGSCCSCGQMTPFAFTRLLFENGSMLVCGDGCDYPQAEPKPPKVEEPPPSTEPIKIVDGVANTRRALIKRKRGPNFILRRHKNEIQYQEEHAPSSTIWHTWVSLAELLEAAKLLSVDEVVKLFAIVDTLKDSEEAALEEQKRAASAAEPAGVEEDGA